MSMSEQEEFEKQRQFLLNGIAGYRLFREYLVNMDESSWKNLESFIEDLEGKDFGFSLSVLSLVTVLLEQMSVMTDESPDAILSVLGRLASLAEVDDDQN